MRQICLDRLVDILKLCCNRDRFAEIGVEYSNQNINELTLLRHCNTHNKLAVRNMTRKDYLTQKKMIESACKEVVSRTLVLSPLTCAALASKFLDALMDKDRKNLGPALLTAADMAAYKQLAADRKSRQSSRNSLRRRPKSQSKSVSARRASEHAS